MVSSATESSRPSSSALLALSLMFCSLVLFLTFALPVRATTSLPLLKRMSQLAAAAGLLILQGLGGDLLVQAQHAHANIVILRVLIDDRAYGPGVVEDLLQKRHVPIVQHTPGIHLLLQYLRPRQSNLDGPLDDGGNQTHVVRWLAHGCSPLTKPNKIACPLCIQAAVSIYSFPAQSPRPICDPLSGWDRRACRDRNEAVSRGSRSEAR